jgi:hypothetical protein
MSIHLQKQPGFMMCVSACVAMILRRPVDHVVDEFHKPFMDFEIEVDTYLAKQGVEAVRTMDRYTLHPNCVYMVTVPSLNSIGKFHEVIVDMRTEKVYDPSREPAQQYEIEVSGEPGFTGLMSWIIDYEIVHAPAIGVIKGIH